MTSTHSSQKEARHDLRKLLTWTGDRMDLAIPDGVLPAFLIEAYNRIAGGGPIQIDTLCTPERSDRLQVLEDEQYAGIELIWLILGLIHHRCNRRTEALRWYRKVAARTAHPLVYQEMADVSQGLHQYSQALEYRRQALALAPDCLPIRRQCVIDLALTGRVTEAVEDMESLLRHETVTPLFHTSYLWYLHLLPDIDQARLFEAHKAWGARHAPVQKTTEREGLNLDPDRPLRVGYLSADFRQHSALYLIESILDGGMGDSFEILGYGNVAHPDRATARLKGKFGRYRDIWGMSDQEVTAQIRRDGIDILVAFAGHTDGHRLGVLAHRPAPIQVDYGGICSSGMVQMDYRITDAIMDPPDIADCYVERSIVFPQGFQYYRPPDVTPPVGPLPASSNGYVTFGVFNNRLKMNGKVFPLWHQILQQLPDAKLVLKFPGGSDEVLVEELIREMAAAGIERDRVTVYPLIPFTDHLTLYNSIDIALDTYPFNGCVTTQEGLWMGVPVVTLSGQRFTSHYGHTLLKRLGLEFFVSTSGEQYVAKAVTLARQTESLARIRAGLRTRMLNSPMMDYAECARQLERTYRQMWRDYCRKKGRDQGQPTP